LNSHKEKTVSTPYLSEIRIMSFNFAPKGWAFCNGQTLPINQNAALFSLLGTTFGGNGQTTFNLPNLQGRMPIHFGNGFDLGQSAGTEAVSLIAAQMPAHAHPVIARNDDANTNAPAGNFWAKQGSSAFDPASNSAMSASAITSIGGSQPHNNMSPYLVVNFCIALVGVFPSRN